MSTKTILSIETSCDETSVAVLCARKTAHTTEFETLSHITLTQAEMHAEYGGVYPNMARREHQINITSIIAEALQTSGLLDPVDKVDETVQLNYLDREELLVAPLTDFVRHHKKPAIDAIVVTTGPGLEPALWVGVNTARALADVWDIPLVPANHMEGHILSVLAKGRSFTTPDIPLPALALLISGGHTELVRIDAIGTYSKLGQTRDDAIGEAFDKAARLMGLPYPGGPKMSKLSSEYSENPLPYDFTLPRPMIHSGDLDFSFSGIKTATRYLIESLPKPLNTETLQAIAYEFETAVTEVLVHKTKKAIVEYGFQSLIVAGGVASSSHIRNELTAMCNTFGIDIFLPEGIMAMDNALMIGIAGALKLQDPTFVAPDLSDVTVNGNWSL